MKEGGNSLRGKSTMVTSSATMIRNKTTGYLRNNTERAEATPPIENTLPKYQ